MPFGVWLDREGFSDPHLRWYLDYCCRDDYGAGIAQVSAWAGIHYFASRHGFHAPGDDGAERDAVLTWPEGNGWLTRRLADAARRSPEDGPCRRRASPTPRAGVEVDAFDVATRSRVRWQAERCIVALPVFIAARVVENPPELLRQAAAHLALRALAGRQRASARAAGRPARRGAELGQRDLRHARARLCRCAPPGARPDTRRDGAQLVPPARARAPMTDRTAVASCSIVHGRPGATTCWPSCRCRIPTSPGSPTRIEITRYGHAMAIPSPGMLGRLGARGRASSPAGWPSRTATGRAIRSSRRRSRAAIWRLEPTPRLRARRVAAPTPLQGQHQRPAKPVPRCSRRAGLPSEPDVDVVLLIGAKCANQE